MIQKPDFQEMEKELTHRQKDLNFIASVFKYDVVVTCLALLFLVVFVGIVNFIALTGYYNTPMLYLALISGIAINIAMIMDVAFLVRKTIGNARLIREDRHRSFLDYLRFSYRLVNKNKIVTILNIIYLLIIIATIGLMVVLSIQHKWIYVFGDFYIFLLIMMLFDIHQKKYRL